MKIKLSLLAGAIIITGMIGWTLTVRPGVPPLQAQGNSAADSAGSPLLGRKMVWAHSMVTYPLDLNVLYHYKPHGYSELYPLYQEQGSEQRTGYSWQAQDIQTAKNAGVDGFSLDIFNTAQVATPYLQGADKIGGFSIAACLDLSTSRNKEEDAFKTIDSYCHIASSHPSAAQINGAFLVFTYGTDQLPVEAWRRIRTRLTEAGDNTYWIIAVDTGGSLNSARPNYLAAVASYMDVFEGGYCFGAPGSHWDDLIALLQKENKPFMGGMMPSYYRTGSSAWDALGTARYRSQWQEYFKRPIPWAMITTWNDLQEDTDIFPSSSWNFTRTDLTHWYSAKFKGTPEPWTQPQLYISTPKTGYPNNKVRAEALVLNPLAHSVKASVQFFDADKKPVGEPVTASIPAGEAQAATVLLPLSAFSPGSFLRAHAKLLDNGNLVASVVSAPVLVLDPQAQPGFPTIYYSIPAARALSDAVQVTHKAEGTSFAYPAKVQSRFAEVLHNTFLIKNALQGRTISQRLPSQPDNGMTVLYTTWGFDVARITDGGFRIGYSDPIYTPPPLVLTLKEKYTFDEGDGSEIADLSSYHQSNKLIDVTWAKPGAGDSSACVHFNGKTSRIDLSVGQTPSGPVSWKLSVRPSAFGSTLYADVGGFIVALGKDGKVLFSRYTTGRGPFTTAYGATPLVIGQWSDIQCTWDGQTSRIYINGHLDAQTACVAGFRSARRSLGCNPFGQSSDYYNGDMDNFELSTQLP